MSDRVKQVCKTIVRGLADGTVVPGPPLAKDEGVALPVGGPCTPDEELGRAWCEANKQWPVKYPPFGQSGPFWKHPYYHSYVGHLPDAASEADAYAAVGRELRKVWAFAAESKAQTEPKS